MDWISSSKEIEQRYIINPHNWLYLPSKYMEYHQAEIGSWRAWIVIDKFYARTQDIFSWAHSDSLTTIQSFLSTISIDQAIKLRVRKILDPKNGTQRAEFTVKEKTNHPEFKIYQEHNIDIDPALAINLIRHIALEHKVTDEHSEHGVRKLRYNIPGPDGKIWDIDALQWLNAWLHIGEIEVNSVDTTIALPKWAVMRVNGIPEFRFLGTKELQKIPWSKLTQEDRKLYLKVIGSKMI
jgi:CYTH domain-containing protein